MKTHVKIVSHERVNDSMEDHNVLNLIPGLKEHMKKIELTQGQVALVDDCDYDYLIQWKWYAHFQKVYAG